MLRCGLAVLCILTAAAGFAQEETPEQVTGTVKETVDTARRTQQELDDWAAERQSLETRYRTAQANITYLEERLARQQEKAEALDDKVGELERRLRESGRLKAVIQDSMNVVLSRLEAVVARDLPFLPRERSARLAGLRRELAEPDLGAAEKLRLLLEALLVEAQYGETVEVTPMDLELGGTEISVDVLRIGRLALFWRTPDGSQVGSWDPVTRSWNVLPDKYRRRIGQAMEIASRMRPVELVALPLGRIER